MINIVNADLQTRNGWNYIDDDTNGGLCNGDAFWTGNVAAVRTLDASYKTCLVDLSTEISPYATNKNYSFNIPSGATINGINLSITRKAAFSSSIADNDVYLIKSDGTYTSVNHANIGTFWGTSDSTVEYGNSTDLWGSTWTDTDINDFDFGGVIAVAGSGVTASINLINITVYYTNGTSGNACLGTLAGNCACGYNWTTNVNSNVILNITGTGTSYISSNISVDKINKPNGCKFIKQNGIGRVVTKNG